MTWTSLLILAALGSGLAQATATQSAGQGAEVVVAKQPTSSYPPIARMARITGTVKIDLLVKPDGSIDSATVVSGHPMLNDAALQSARQIQFECKECGDTSMHYRISYKYELGDAIFCETIDASTYRKSSYKKVSESEGTITVFDRPTGECDPVVTTQVIKVRSAKCLYLWRCGMRYPL